MWLMLAFAMFVLAFLIGVVHYGSFGARCEHAFPNDGLAQERCVYDLANGKRL
jgi:hypothetical protein